MNLNTEENDGSTIVFVMEERLDANNSGDLKIEINQILETGKHNLIIDLKEVRFIDSSGLGVLVSGFKNASAKHGSIKLVGLQTQVRSMFELTRLHRVFDIFATADDALVNS